MQTINQIHYIFLIWHEISSPDKGIKKSCKDVFVIFLDTVLNILLGNIKMNDQELLEVIYDAIERDLVKLNLSGYQLTKLPPEIGELTNITILTLCDNKLKKLPPEIGKLKNLVVLDLSCNELKRLPPNIGKLTNLAILSMHNNKLKQLPSEISKLINLSILYLSRNELEQLPCMITKLTKLITLDLANNEFHVPKNIYKQSPQKIILHILNEQSGSYQA